MTTSALINVMTKAARTASKTMLRDFGEIDKLQISKKGTANFVTSADIKVEQTLIAELNKARPAFGVLSEESTETIGRDANTRFVIDPIDGTTNFIHAIPYICMAISCEKRQADGSWSPVAAVIYDPIHDEMFHAEKGQGAFLNGYRMQVSRRTEDRMVATAAPRSWKEGYANTLQVLERVTSHEAVVVRCGGSAALDLAYVAAGRLDATWYHTLQWWDMSAGILLVEEAGGRVSTLTGEVPRAGISHVLAGSPAMHAQLLELLKL